MVIEIPSNLSPELVPLSWLLGTWTGSGRLGAGEETDAHFTQTATFATNGLPYVQYTAETWLSDADGTILRPLSVETGFWQLDRTMNDADCGPGLIPADIVPALRNADDVEALRNADGGFDIMATIVHPGGISELYYGSIKGPKIQLSTDAVMRSAGSKDYSAATRIFGLVNGELYWRWDVAARGHSLAAHASAALHKV